MHFQVRFWFVPLCSNFPVSHFCSYLGVRSFTDNRKEVSMPPVLNDTRCNRRVTCDPSPSNDRSESDIAANPLNPYNMVGASKRFINPLTYAFSLAASTTFYCGQSWIY